MFFPYFQIFFDSCLFIFFQSLMTHNNFKAWDMYRIFSKHKQNEFRTLQNRSYCIRSNQYNLDNDWLLNKSFKCELEKMPKFFKSGKFSRLEPLQAVEQDPLSNQEHLKVGFRSIKVRILQISYNINHLKRTAN